jgi:nucleoside 2-deoxyribosyltransferase
MPKVYYAAPISTTAEFNDSKRVAERIRSLGYEVYAAAENASINDKSNDPTPTDIYDADMSELLSSDIVVANLTGGRADGTITEIGAVAGFNEGLALVSQEILIIGYTSSARLQKPQFHKGIPSASANHLTLGAIEKWGEFVGTEDAMIKKLERPL